MVNEQKNQTSATKWRAFFVYLQKNDNYGPSIALLGNYTDNIPESLYYVRGLSVVMKESPWKSNSGAETIYKIPVSALNLGKNRQKHQT